jgi:hypothetical protein
MDRDYKNPEDVAKAGQDRMMQALTRVVRRGIESRPFIYRLQFKYDDGRSAPLLFIGSLNRSWSDYINGNLRSNDLAVGTCRTAGMDAGRTRLELAVERGRGNRDAYLAELNRTLRQVNVEAVFADGEADGAATSAEPGEPSDGLPASPTSVSVEAGGEVTDAAAAPADQAPPDLAALLKDIQSGFAAFKQAPSADGLSALKQLVSDWQRHASQSPEWRESSQAQTISKLGAMLDAKGDAFVSNAGG